MTKKQQILKQVKLTKAMIDLIEKSYGKDKCEGYLPDCPNCRGQLLRGNLWHFLDLLQWELKEFSKK